jgi:hypothetical protein
LRALAEPVYSATEILITTVLTRNHRCTEAARPLLASSELRKRMNRTARPSLRLVIPTIAAAVLAARPAHAHEKWFHHADPYPLRPDLFLRPLPLAFVGAVLLATLAGALVWRARGGRGFLLTPRTFGARPDRVSTLYALMPLMLAIHVAVPLLVNGVQGRLFSPDNDLPGAWRYALGLAETGIALALFYGALTRFAAVGLAVLWLIGVFVLGPEPMLDNALYLGFAVFFFFAGRGPVAIDRLLFPRLEPRPDRVAWAVPALRIGLGLSLVAVAFTEKFLNLPLALGFLNKYPLNFTAALGIPMSNEVFVLCAGSVELLVGLWILLSVFPREIVVIAWFPINLTLTIFNWVELIGHLPIYGILALLLVWTPDRENDDLWRTGLRDRLLPVAPAEEPGEPDRRAAAA